MNNDTGASKTSDEHTLVFHLSALPALEATMGVPVARSAVEALGRGLPALSAHLLTDEKERETLAGLPPGLWATRYRSAPRESGAQAEKQDAIHIAATRLGMEWAKEIFGGATARFVRLRVVLLPGHPPALDIPCLLENAPASADPAAEHALGELLEHGGLRTFLQPIVAFPAGGIIGYEALARGPADSPIERADQLFGTAAGMGCTHELELACAWQALRWLEGARRERRLPEDHWLAINLSATSLADDELRRALARPGVVVEITEHLPLDNARALLPLIAELRARGARLALDDTGCGFADQRAAETLRPDFVKLCITIIRSVGRGSADVLSDLAATIAHLRELGIGILAEGVETQAEAEQLSRFDIDYAQGWLYGKPQAADTLLAGELKTED
ncbi:MAG: EAL domain-containing protein [Zoogloeaceae bacterium]|nr:EAL domain-containing protein [Zoogloeaceae bacterium]